MNFNIDHLSHTPLYVQIEEQLRIAIHSREWATGKKIPNEVELSQTLGVARSTIRQAINNLVRDGLLLRKKSIGTFVQQAPISSKSASWLSFSQEMTKLGVKVRNYEMHISWREAREEIAQLFGVLPGTKLLRLERLRGDAQAPFVHFVSYFSPAIGLTGDEDFTKPLYEILEKQHNTVALKSVEEISATFADEIRSQKLGIPLNSPMLKRKRRVYDSNGRPIEWNVGFYRADSFVYTVESTREI